jgi:hypothetical protein
MVENALLKRLTKNRLPCGLSYVSFYGTTVVETPRSVGKRIRDLLGMGRWNWTGVGARPSWKKLHAGLKKIRDVMGMGRWNWTGVDETP